MGVARRPVVSVATHGPSSVRWETQAGAAQLLWSYIARPIHAQYRSNARSVQPSRLREWTGHPWTMFRSAYENRGG